MERRIKVLRSCVNSPSDYLYIYISIYFLELALLINVWFVRLFVNELPSLSHWLPDYSLVAFICICACDEFLCVSSLHLSHYGIKIDSGQHLPQDSKVPYIWQGIQEHQEQCLTPYISSFKLIFYHLLPYSVQSPAVLVEASPPPAAAAFGERRPRSAQSGHASSVAAPRQRARKPWQQTVQLRLEVPSTK